MWYVCGVNVECLVGNVWACVFVKGMSSGDVGAASQTRVSVICSVFHFNGKAVACNVPHLVILCLLSNSCCGLLWPITVLQLDEGTLRVLRWRRPSGATHETSTH